MIKYKVRRTSKFKRDYKLVLRRGYDKQLLWDVVSRLASGEQLPAKYKDHPLKGDKTGKRECHITPDWLLIYKISNDTLYLILSRTGTHSDLLE